MKRWGRIFGPWVGLFAACNGPPAPDAAVCQDYVHRICLDPVCATVTSTLALGGDCETTLLQRTGCANADFAFSTPSRDTFLASRLPLLRAGSSRETHPDCDDVQDSFNQYPDVVAFLKTAPPDGGP